jgi:hypothetical protein
MGHWSTDKHANMRVFFEQFAKERNFDPLVPENWYSLPAMEVYESKVNIQTPLSHNNIFILSYSTRSVILNRVINSNLLLLDPVFVIFNYLII